MDRCPCCNARLSGVLVCPRCQANVATVISAEQQAQYLFEYAMQLWFVQEPKLAVLALTKAISHKKSLPALVFRDFIVHHYCTKLLTLLAQSKYEEVKNTLVVLRELHPRHQLLVQLQGFTQYLLAQHKTTYGLRLLDDNID